MLAGSLPREEMAGRVDIEWLKKYFSPGRKKVKMETGRYTLQENIWLADGKKYAIKKRKADDKKPHLYLIQVSPFHYISSLFPVPGEQETYSFDSEGKLYRLKKQAGKVEIEVAE